MKTKCTGCDKTLRPKDNRTVYAKDPQKRPFCPDCSLDVFRRWVGKTFFKAPLAFAPVCCGSWDCTCSVPPKKTKR